MKYVEPLKNKDDIKKSVIILKNNIKEIIYCLH